MAKSAEGSAHQAAREPARPRAKLSVLSLALAIVALAVFWPLMVAAVFDPGAVRDLLFIVAALAGVVLGTGAVVTGVLARRRAARGAAGKGGIALAGILLGLVAVVLPAIILAWLTYQLYYDYEQFRLCVKGSGKAYPAYLCLKGCPDLLDSLCRHQIGWNT